MTPPQFTIQDGCLKELLVKLPKIDPDIVRASDNWTEYDLYKVADRRPKLNEWYINMFVSEKARSIQKHTHPRHIANHKRDYRWRYCMVVVASDNSKFGLPPVTAIPTQPAKGQEEIYLPPDHGDICWQEGAETFTRKEVYYLLWTQRAMIGNDIKQTGTASSEVLEVIESPRIPKY